MTKRTTRRLATLAWGLAAATLAACSEPPRLDADHAWVRLAAVPGRPAAAYFTLHGGAVDATLIDVRAPLAIRSELHESMGAGGMTTMKPLRQLAVPARAVIAFKPGARHVMLFDIDPTVKPGGTMALDFVFANGFRMERMAKVVAAGEPAPGS